MKPANAIILFLAVTAPLHIARAQASFDAGEGCLNVVEVSYAQGIGEYGDGGISANYLHEKFINERFSIGAGIGYNHHEKYKFSAIPVFLSTHYFFLDKQFSPFVNLCVGGFALFNAKNVKLTRNTLYQKKNRVSVCLCRQASV